MGYSEVSTQADEVYGSIELISKSHLDANTCGPKPLSKLREVNVRAFDCFNEEEWEHLNTLRPLAILPSIRKVSLASINASRRLKSFAWTDTNRTLGIEDLQFHQSAILHYKISEILHGLTNLKRFTHNYSMILDENPGSFYGGKAAGYIITTLCTHVGSTLESLELTSTTPFTCWCDDGTDAARDDFA